MSDTKSYLSTKYVDIYVDLKTKIGYANWKDYCNEEDYKSAILMQLKLVETELLTYMVCDIRNFKGTTITNANWTNDVIQPKLHNSTLKKIAYIVGDSVFGNFTLTVIKKKMDSDGILLTNAFKDVDSAKTWLLEK